MSPQFRSFLLNFAALALAFAVLSYLFIGTHRAAPTRTSEPSAVEAAQPAAAAGAATTTAATTTGAVATSTKPVKTTLKKPAAQSSAAQGAQVSRLQNPYSSAPLTADAANTAAREALVNILCTPRIDGGFSPISASGVLIDPRGIILTNAHVAQYVLLSQDPRINLTCSVRAGAPARALWQVEVLYLPPAWVQAHAQEILTPRPQGTGEHDYALLRVTGALGSATLPQQFPYLAPDTREGVAFAGDQVLVASYPAEFLGGISAEYSLYPASSVAQIGQLITFATNSIDVLSLGGVIEAQSGSSGGAVENAWGKLVGLIVTTSEGTTTAERDLHALTLSYVSRDLQTQSGFDLPTTLGGDLAAEAADFRAQTAPSLLQLYRDTLFK